MLYHCDILAGHLGWTKPKGFIMLCIMILFGFPLTICLKIDLIFKKCFYISSETHPCVYLCISFTSMEKPSSLHFVTHGDIQAVSSYLCILKTTQI